MPNLPELLRERLEQEKCPKCGGHHIPCLVPGQVWTCPHCNDSGLNPAYDALWEVVRTICRVCIEANAHSDRPYPNPDCRSCGGTGHITRSIEGWPKGALAGAIIVALESTELYGEQEAFWHHFSQGESAFSGFYGDDPDLAAVTAVLEAMDGTRGGL